MKSDRESIKDQTKDKQEKEKQPTIILKTREQSTPKEERPQSPKTIRTSASEADGPHPCKIAQNENKEKKSAGKIIFILVCMDVWWVLLYLLQYFLITTRCLQPRTTNKS